MINNGYQGHIMGVETTYFQALLPELLYRLE
jgi:hypothetical protein